MSDVIQDFDMSKNAGIDEISTAMRSQIISEYIQKMLDQGKALIVYPEDPSDEAAAEKMAEELESSLGVLTLKNDNEQTHYAVLLPVAEILEIDNDSTMQNESMPIS